MVGFTIPLGAGAHGEKLLERLPGWRLLREAPVPSEQMHTYVAGPTPLKMLLRRGVFHPLRYELEYAPGE